MACLPKKPTRRQHPLSPACQRQKIPGGSSRPYPDESWTWDDYYDAAVKLTKEDGSQFGTAMNPTNNQDGWMNIVYSMGGKVISDDKTSSGFDDPNTLRAMDYEDMNGILAEEN